GFHCPGDDATAVLTAREVGADTLRFTAGLAYPTFSVSEPFGVHIDPEHARSLSREPHRGSATNTRGHTGYDGCLTT
ncbi:MAG TPA: hypothetical protein VLA89_19380, partial [Gemmatimonadales bacterium]|nr:hypothetical protein [Gemmatimonadales bacterium]